MYHLPPHPLIEHLKKQAKAHGAPWQERHGHDDNVHGTLAWASRNHDLEEGNWVDCARALIEHGLPVDKLSGEYSDEVAAVLAEERARAKGGE